MSDRNLEAEGSVVETHDFGQRTQLWDWRYRDGGARLPKFASKIPHVFDTDPPTTQTLLMMKESLKRCKEMALETKQLQMEFIYSKQQADLLQRERDLLKWHNSNNQKILKLKQGEIRFVRQKNESQRQKLGAVHEECQRTSLEQANLNAEVAKQMQQTNVLEQERQQIHEEFKVWLSRRNDFIMETTAERRQAADERKKRWSEYKKLQLAINRDKKTHSKLDFLQGIDELTHQTQSRTRNFKEQEFIRAADVTGPQRSAILEELAVEN